MSLGMVNEYGKKDSLDVKLKIFKGGDYPGLSDGFNKNHKSPYLKKEREQREWKFEKGHVSTESELK